MSALLTPAEVAAHLQVKADLVRAWIKNGTLRGINVGNGKTKPRFRVRPEDLEEFERARVVGTRPKPRRRRKPAKDVISFF